MTLAKPIEELTGSASLSQCLTIEERSPMRTPASIFKHPIHPMLIVFPIGLWDFLGMRRQGRPATFTECSPKQRTSAYQEVSNKNEHETLSQPSGNRLLAMS